MILTLHALLTQNILILGTIIVRFAFIQFVWKDDEAGWHACLLEQSFEQNISALMNLSQDGMR